METSQLVSWTRQVGPPLRRAHPTGDLSRRTGADASVQVNPEIALGKVDLRQSRLENCIDWIMDNQVRRSNLHAALKERQSIMGKVDRARHLYINGDLDLRAFTKIQDEAEAAADSIYVPEFDEAVEAGNIPADFGTLWQTASVASKDRLLGSTVQAVYVDLDKRKIVGLLPKKRFLAPILAMAERAGMAVLDASRQCL